MAQRKTLVTNVYNFGSGGINLTDKLEDIDVTVANNMVIDRSGRITTRKGYTQHSAVPKSIVTLNKCDSATDWSVSGDASNLTLDTTNEIRGTGCLNFDISAFSSGTSKLTLAASSTVDLTLTKLYGLFQVNFPTGFATNLTSITIKAGSDSSNYYKWTMTNPTAATNTAIKVAFADATTTGTPVDAAIDFFELEFTTVAGYVGYTDFIVDDIRFYGELSTVPVTSLFSFEHDTTGVHNLFCASGSSMFLYSETNSVWEQIETGLTEFETGTTKRTRWDFMTYLNRVYMVNGFDTLREWTGVKMTTYSGEEGRYIRMFKGRAYLSGRDTNPSFVYYTNLMNFASTYPTTYGNSIFIGTQDDGRINAMHTLQDTLVAFKDRKVITFYEDSGITQQDVDSQGGGYSQRSVHFVGNSLFYFSDDGVRSLQPRSGVDGTIGLESIPLTEKLRPTIALIDPKSYNSCAAIFDPTTSSYIFSFDTGNDDVAETSIVYSSLIGKMWTSASYPSVYDYTRWFNSSEKEKYLMASATSGIIYVLNDGYTDDGVDIEYSLSSKRYDFGDISQFNMAEEVSIIGRKAQGTIITASVNIDGLEVQSDTITDADQLDELQLATIGSLPVGETTIGGEETTDDLETFRFLKRLPLADVGQEITVSFSSTESPSLWKIDRLEITAEGEERDLFPIVNIG